MVKGRRGGLLHLHLLLTVIEHDLVGLAVLGLGHLHTLIFSLTGLNLSSRFVLSLVLFN